MTQRAVMGLAKQAFGLAREPFQEGVGIGHLALRLFQRLAVLQRHQGPEPFGVFLDQGGPVAQEFGPLVRVGTRPVGEGVVRRLDGAPGLGDAEVGDMADDLAGRRVVHGDAVGAGGDRLAGDEGVLTQELEAGGAGGGVHGEILGLLPPLWGRVVAQRPGGEGKAMRNDI